MKIIVAPDSFKGSLCARDAARAMEKGIKKADSSAQVIVLPVADGGEGTLDALTDEKNRIMVKVTGPYGEKLDAQYGFDGERAIIEMAQAAGLCLTEERHTADATTYGVGEMIADAVGRGCTKITLTAGGSATSDCGCGMMASLGVKFFDKDGSSFIPTGRTLADVAGFDLSRFCADYGGCEFTIATDVKNPLCGDNGSVYVYSRQKGASDNELEIMENGMANIARLVSEKCGRDIADIPGSGAAGGLPVFLLAFAAAKIRSGIDTVLEFTKFEDALDGGIDAVFIGEGKIDRQSLWGKAISGVCSLCSKKNIPVDCLVGCVGDDRDELKSMGLRSISAITDIAPDTASAMSGAADHLCELAYRRTRELKGE